MRPVSSFRRRIGFFGFLSVVLILAIGPAVAQTLPLPTPAGTQSFKPRPVQRPEAKGPLAPTRVIVTVNAPARLDGSYDPAAILAAQTSVRSALPASAQIVQTYSHIPAMSVVLPRADLEALSRTRDVVAVNPDHVIRLMDTQADGLTQAPVVHGFGYTGEGVRVAVIDTGIDTAHPSTALLEDVFFERCFRKEGDCPGGTANAEDQDGHGTHVAGIITGSGGIAPDAQVAALKVFTTGDTTDTNILNALNYIIANDAALKIDLINMSLGGNNYPTQAACNADNAAYKAAFQTLNGLGIAIFVSTGNDGDVAGVGAPACVSGAIGVGSQNDGHSVFCSDDVYGGVTCFSNATPLQGAGELVDVLAPGCSILSEYLGGGYEELCGTSMATPMALGVAALLKDYKKSLTPAKLEKILEDSGVPVLDARIDTTFPAVNAQYAYGSLVAKPPTGLTITNQDGTSTTLAWAGPGDQTAYIFERSANGGPFIEIGTPGALDTSFVDTTLDCGTLKYQVRAMKDAAISLPSNVVTRAALTACPGAPSGLLWAFSAPDDFLIGWADNATDESGFVIERSSDFGQTFTDLEVIAAPDTTFYTDTSLSECGEYTYRVRAYRDGDFVANSAPSPVVFAGCPPANDSLATPVVFTGTSDTDTQTEVRYANRQLFDYAHQCRYAGPDIGGATMWYSFTPSQDGFVSLSTAEATYDTVMTVLTGGIGAWTEIACNDDIDEDLGVLQSQLLFVPVTSGTTYYVEISSWDPAGLFRPETLHVDYAFTDTLPIPPNDTFDNAAPIAGPELVETVQYAYLATSDVDDPVLSCRYETPGAGSHSLWYSFTPTLNFPVTIDTSGSTGSYADTLIAVLDGTPGAFSEIACDEDGGDELASRIADLDLSVGTTYYLYIARWDSSPADAPGQLHLNFSVNYNLLENGSFELPGAAGVPDYWKRKGTGSTNDKFKCDASGLNVRSGSCAFRYVGNAGEASTLQQKVEGASIVGHGILPEVGDEVLVALWSKGTKAKGTLTMKIKFSDATPTEKAKTTFGPSASFMPAFTFKVLPSGAIASVAVSVKSTATAGKSYVDDVVLFYTPAPRDGRSVLPPPSAPSGFRGNN